MARSCSTQRRTRSGSTSELAGNISIVNLTARMLAGTRPVSSEFVNILGGVYDPVNGEIYLVNYDSDTVVVFDGASGSSLGSINLSAYCCLPAASRSTHSTAISRLPRWASGDRSLSFPRLPGRVISVGAVGGFPSGTAFDPFTGDLYVPEPGPEPTRRSQHILQSLPRETGRHAAG